MPTVIDLFAGAGGLSQSLEASGWVSVAAVEIDRDAIETLRLNQSRGLLRRTRLVHADIRDIHGEDVRPSGAPSNWRPDLLAGGPPCQPFSSAGFNENFTTARRTIGLPGQRWFFNDFPRKYSKRQCRRKRQH